MTGWCLYILACGDGTLYTGITNDIAARLARHAAGTGARYTRGRGPVRLVYVEDCADRSSASRREAAVKKLDAKQKRELIMTSVTVYGIKNCDTMKKAFAWLDKRKVAYAFHDYKKEGADEAMLKRAIAVHGWEEVINRKGTSWRQLPEKEREKMTEKSAIKAALENPSLIRRPMLAAGGKILLGFDEEAFKKTLLK